MQLGLAADGLDLRGKAVLLLQADLAEAAGHAFDGDGFGRQQALRRQLLAAQGDHHRLATEVGVEADVPQRADGDDGVRSVDGHAAAIAVLQATTPSTFG